MIQALSQGWDQHKVPAAYQPKYPCDSLLCSGVRTHIEISTHNFPYCVFLYVCIPPLSLHYFHIMWLILFSSRCEKSKVFRVICSDIFHLIFFFTQTYGLAVLTGCI